LPKELRSPSYSVLHHPEGRRSLNLHGWSAVYRRQPERLARQRRRLPTDMTRTNSDTFGFGFAERSFATAFGGGLDVKLSDRIAAWFKQTGCGRTSTEDR
jgi:hypothetical protein